jgi:hypothetical protein
VLGERPDHSHGAERWDQAARTLARYRFEYDVADGANPPGSIARLRRTAARLRTR